MVIKTKNENTGQEYYVKGVGNFFTLKKCSDSGRIPKDAIDDMPNGWEIIHVNGKPIVKRT